MVVEHNGKTKDVFPATVAEIINNSKVVINRGLNHDVYLNQRFLIYTLSDEEIIDPESKKSLGYLEIVKGTGKIIHVMEKMAIIRSDKIKTNIVRKPSQFRLFPKEEFVEEIELSFENPMVGDKAKPI